MTKIFIGFLLIFMIPVIVNARETEYFFPVHPALTRHVAKVKLLDDVAVYFAGQNHPPIVETIGEWRSHRKTHSIFRSDESACQVAFLSALISLQKRARVEGGNAVVNIRSIESAKPKPWPDYRCIAGATNAGVRLRGDVVFIDEVALTKARKKEHSGRQVPADAPYPIKSLGAFTKHDFRKTRDPATNATYYEIYLNNQWQKSTLTDGQYDQLPE